jgi:hypothetical protein
MTAVSKEKLQNSVIIHTVAIIVVSNAKVYFQGQGISLYFQGQGIS